METRRDESAGENGDKIAKDGKGEKKGAPGGEGVDVQVPMMEIWVDIDMNMDIDHRIGDNCDCVIAPSIESVSDCLIPC